MSEQGNRLPLIGEKAPEFEAETTQGKIIGTSSPGFSSEQWQGNRP